MAFVVVDGGLVFGRRWILLDAGRGRIAKRWGLLAPVRDEEHSLHDYDAVALRFEAGSSDNADTYPVVLRTRGGGLDLRLSSSAAYQNSREPAVRVAIFLRLPLVDAATDHEAIVQPDRTDASLRERLRGEGQTTERTPRPLRMRTQVQEAASRVQIAIPGKGVKRVRLLGIAIPIGILV
jgi:hypothetical protein